MIMTENMFRFEFAPTVSLAEAELTLHLATYAAEGLHGEARVRLEVSYQLDRSANVILVGGGTEVGDALVKIFTRLLIRQYGEDDFQVRRAETGLAGATRVKTTSRQKSAATAAA
jgi:hypothetical protein